MKEIVNKKCCTGCGACYNSCPKRAISMIEDIDGFSYPNIDEKKCINCGLCKKKCPVINKNNNKSINICYAGYNKNINSRKTSSSGGIFELIAKNILSDNGIVVGAAFNNNRLEHYIVKDIKNLEKLKGSKYLQSDLKNIFIEIKSNIKTRKVLFVGTPCQVAGLKSFIREENSNLICIDLFCHGVPSPKLYKKYVDELELNNNDKLIEYNFRDNSTGWDTYSNTAKFKKKNICELASENSYMKLFLCDVALRESCYNCNFKLDNKYSDITLGDFWGVKSYYPEIYNKEGVSAIIINTNIGKEIFDCIKKDLVYKKCSIDEILKNNSSLKLSSKSPKNRKKFFKDLNNTSFDKLSKKYATKSLYTRIIIKSKQIIKKIICHDKQNPSK